MWDAILKFLSQVWDDPYNFLLKLGGLLVIATFIIQSKQYLENKKKSKKGQIIEILNDVVQRSINHLEYEISKLENREYLLYDKVNHQYAPCITKIPHEESKFKSFQLNEPLLNRVIPRISITRKMKNHNSSCNVLNENLRSIENDLKSKINFEDVKRMVMAHNTENPGQEIHLLSDDYREEQGIWPSATKEGMLKHVIVGIINGKYEFSSQKGSKFWDKYGSAFLGMRNGNYISKQLGELEQISNRMLNDCKNLKKELEELREKYLDDYYIPRDAVPMYWLK